jgi:polar amino acid transport system substrate-binding protein
MSVRDADEHRKGARRVKPMNYSLLVCRLLVVLVVSACMAGCSGLPRDQVGTLGRVQGGRLRVGLVEHPPFVMRAGDQPAGAEVELVKQFAATLGATPEWHWGGEQEHMEALEHFELDVVVGGITDQTPWSKYVGLTGPYFEETFMVGVPASTPPIKEIEGMQVSTRDGEVVAAYLKKKGAVPLEVDDLSQVRGAVAAPQWKLEQLGLAGTEVKLQTEKHVMAIPPGENGFLKRLEEFLYQQGSQVKGLLQQAEVRQ